MIFTWKHSARYWFDQMSMHNLNSYGYTKEFSMDILSKIAMTNKQSNHLGIHEE